MKAMGVTGPDFMPRLFDVDEPFVAPDGVVVDVIAASVNDFDRAAVRGRYLAATDIFPVASLAPDQFAPILLGRDFVGRVAAVGDDVDYVDVGMYVAGALAPQPAGQPGTFTDKVAVPARLLAPIPDGVDVVEAAAVGLAGVTASDAVGALGAASLGQMVVHGPVSGVGGFALQLAKARGAVVAAITPQEQADLALALGADVVIPDGPSATRSIEKVQSIFGGGVDTAIHVAGHRSVVAGVVRPGGRFTSVADGSVFDAHGGFVPTNVAPSGHELMNLLFKVAAHRLDSHVHRTVSFDQLAGAVIARSTADGGRVVLVR
jgi:NADPH:quinone reductase-like Zn-dependent oxidoreductase